MTRRRHQLTDWQSIEDEKEKYAAYLCSREWGKKREQVRERAQGMCERCFANAMNAVHHLTYARKYDEHIDDLQAICTPCHDFTHGKSDVDPCAWAYRIRMYVKCIKRAKKPPFPVDASIGLRELSPRLKTLVRAIEILVAVFPLETHQSPAWVMDDQLPFDFYGYLLLIKHGGINPWDYHDAICQFFPKTQDDQSWFAPEDDTQPQELNSYRATDF